MSLGSVIAYIAGEGLVDAANANGGTTVNQTINKTADPAQTNSAASTAAVTQ